MIVLLGRILGVNQKTLVVVENVRDHQAYEGEKNVLGAGMRCPLNRSDVVANGGPLDCGCPEIIEQTAR